MDSFSRIFFSRALCGLKLGQSIPRVTSVGNLKAVDVAKFLLHRPGVAERLELGLCRALFPRYGGNAYIGRRNALKTFGSIAEGATLHQTSDCTKQCSAAYGASSQSLLHE